METISHRDYRRSHLAEGERYHQKFSSDTYRSILWGIEQAQLMNLLRVHRVSSSARLLDFACGTGRILRFLEPFVGNAIGVDVSESMLAVARISSPNAQLMLCDITRSNQLDSTRFELITAFRFFPNAEPALREESMEMLARLLAPEGILILNNHRRVGGSAWRLRRFSGVVGRAKRTDLHGMSDREVYDLSHRHGLRVIDEKHIGVVPVLKDRNPLLPLSVLRAIEQRASDVRGFAPFASNKIYVLRHAAASASRIRDGR